MAGDSLSSILLLAEPAASAEDVRALLVQAGYRVDERSPTSVEPASITQYELIVFEGGPAAETLCRKLRGRAADAFVPILFLTREPAGRLMGLQAGADTCFQRPFLAAELLSQVRALLRLKHSHDELSARTAEFHLVNNRLRQAYQQVDQELELARRIQQSMLPHTLPEMHAARFAVYYHPCGRVGGDFYDVFRLDETHVGFYVADVVGHGVPASLLTMFLKKAVHTKEINGREYRLLAPDEVLYRLNRTMIDQALAEHPFITMVYGLVNAKERTLSFARAGHPHPLHIPDRGAPHFLEVPGSLLGVFEAPFTTRTEELRPGDKVLFYTDGLEMLNRDDRPTGELLLSTVTRSRHLSIHELIPKVAHDLTSQDSQPDDLTLLGLEML